MMGKEYMHLLADAMVEEKYNSIRFNGANPLQERLKNIREKLLKSPLIPKAIEAMIATFRRMDGTILGKIKERFEIREFKIPQLDLKIPPGLAQAITSNVDLIRGIAEKQSTLLEDAVRQAVAKGSDYDVVRRAVLEQSDKGIAYANFVACDQVGKAYASINQERQAQAGFPGYIWHAFLDSHTRATHRLPHGKFFLWKGPSHNDVRPRSKAGLTLNPGEDYRCRCEAIPAFDERDAQLIAA